VDEQPENKERDASAAGADPARGDAAPPWRRRRGRGGFGVSIAFVRPERWARAATRTTLRRGPLRLLTRGGGDTLPTGLADRSFAAFISYSHADKTLALALQSGLQRIAKAWYQRRAIRVFLDSTNLAANPKLWGTIETALRNSEFFILLASPEAAASPWVRKEVGFWISHKPADTILIALTDGKIVWENASSDFDWDTTTALPSLLRGKFHEVPLHTDLGWARAAEHLSPTDDRFLNSVADLAAPLRHQAKDALVGEDLRQHRRTIRLFRAAITVLATLLTAVRGFR